MPEPSKKTSMMNLPVERIFPKAIVVRAEKTQETPN